MLKVDDKDTVNPTFGIYCYQLKILVLHANVYIGGLVWHCIWYADDIVTRHITQKVKYKNYKNGFGHHYLFICRIYFFGGSLIYFWLLWVHRVLFVDFSKFGRKFLCMEWYKVNVCQWIHVELYSIFCCIQRISKSLLVKQ